MEQEHTDVQMDAGDKEIPTIYKYIASYPPGLTQDEMHEIHMRSGPFRTFSLDEYQRSNEHRFCYFNKILALINNNDDSAKKILIEYILRKRRMYDEGSHTENYEGYDAALEVLHFICTELVQRKKYALLEDFVEVYYFLGNLTKIDQSGTCVDLYLVDIINQFDDNVEFCYIFEKFILNLTDEQYDSLQIRDKIFSCYWKNFIIEAKNKTNIENKETITPMY